MSIECPLSSANILPAVNRAGIKFEDVAFFRIDVEGPAGRPGSSLEIPVFAALSAQRGQTCSRGQNGVTITGGKELEYDQISWISGTYFSGIVSARKSNDDGRVPLGVCRNPVHG